MHRFIINRRYLLFILVALTFLLYYFDLKLIISHNVKHSYKSRLNVESAKTYIENLCSLFNDKENPVVLGSMCKELCKTRNNYASFMTYQLSGRYDPEPEFSNKHNDNLYTDFKTVLIFEDGKRNESKKFVLKAGKKFFLDVDTHMDFDFADKSINEQLDFLAEYIESSLKRKFDFDVDKSYRDWLRRFKKNSKMALENIEKYADKEDFNYYLRLFYLDEYKTYMRSLEMADKKLLARYITNFVVLTGQDEYLFYKLFQSKPGTLKINGTCGHFYMTEYVDDLSKRVVEMSVDERKSLASKFLELIHSLDTAYIVKQVGEDVTITPKNRSRLLKPTPLQFCDVKLDNFGVNNKGELKIIDTDTIFPDSYIFRARKCSSHDDCHFFDCKSYCDPQTQRCLTNRVNNNLQTFCEKILNNTVDVRRGVLSGVGNFGTYIHSEIMSRLEKCQSPGVFKNTDIPIAASDSLMRSLNILLKQ